MVRLKPVHSSGPLQMNVAIGGPGQIVPSFAVNGTTGVEINDVPVGAVVPMAELPKVARENVSLTRAAKASPSAHAFAFVRVYRLVAHTETAWIAVDKIEFPQALRPCLPQEGMCMRKVTCR